jgi:siderophore synthetase component
VCGHRDKAPVQVDLTPLHPLQFDHPQPRTGFKGEERLERVVRLGQQGDDIF